MLECKVQLKKDKVIRKILNMFADIKINYSPYYKDNSNDEVTRELFKQYDVIYKNCVDESKPYVYLLGEEHNTQEIKIINGLFISCVLNSVQENDKRIVVLIEGSEMEKIAGKELIKAMKSHLFISDKRELVDFYGWDISEELLVEAGLPHEDFQLVCKAADNTEKLLEITHREITTIENNSLFIKINNSETMENFLFEELVEYQHLLEEEKYLTNNYSDLADQYSNLCKQIKKGVITEESKKMFPARTRSMISSLQKIQQWISEGKINGPVFLVTGSGHLKTPKDKINTKEYELNSLYDELKKYNCIVMIPKIMGDY
jgi:hypothetical protein